MFLVSSLRQLPWYRWLKWGDYLLFGLIILTAIGLFFQGPALQRPVSDAQGIIRADGQIQKTITAEQLQQSGHFELESHGYHYTIEYDHGQVRISHADCPDQVCVQTGWVSRFGEVSACVPGQIIVEVSSPADAGANLTEHSGEVDVVLQ